jgi:tripartite-type tricarboxylate transporter receptor subunit TctC
MDAVAKAAPDGHILMSNVSTTLTLPHFYKKVPFDVLADFTPIGLIGSGDFVLVVNQAIPVKTVTELVAYVRKQPGKINYGSAGLGTHHHLCMELLMSMTGMELTHVPYKGSAGATTDILSGQVQVMFLPIQVAATHVASGRIRILGATRIVRHPAYPDIQTLDEAGIKGYDVDPWYALWGPKAMQPAMVAKYNTLLRTLLARDDVKRELAEQGVVARPGAPEELRALAVKEIALWNGVLKNMPMEGAGPA